MKIKKKLSRKAIRDSIGKPAIPRNKIIVDKKTKSNNKRKNIKDVFREENLDLRDIC